ncbi:MAG: hypothetical protein IPF47_23950 [Gemmatimonadetes bacterium]|nr:hypothetical protein [Gemmatimonadota bacterium]
MSENIASIDDIPEGEELAPPAPTPPKRGPGHRGQDVRDTMAEMAAKAHEISLEAGSRMAGTMREVVGAAAGLTPFAIESARDLVQYMVRRAQMTQDEADKLMRDVEAAHASMPKVAKPEPAKVEPPKKVAPAAAPPPVVTLEHPVVPRPPKVVAPEPVKAAPKPVPTPTPSPAPAPVAEAAKPAKAVVVPSAAQAKPAAKAPAPKAVSAKAPAPVKPAAKAPVPAAKAPAKVATKAPAKGAPAAKAAPKKK